MTEEPRSNGMRTRASDSEPHTVAEAAQFIPPEHLADVALKRLKWSTQRWMAWVCLWAILIQHFTSLHVCFWFPEVWDRIVKGADFLEWEQIIVVSIPLAYMGLTGVDKWLSKR